MTHEFYILSSRTRRSRDPGPRTIVSDPGSKAGMTGFFR